MPTTVFIVDDEKNIRRTVRLVLEGEGYTVEEAASGEEALARLPEVDADVVLLDVQLPGLSGHDVLEGMRKLTLPDLPTVIMISGHGTLSDAVRAVKGGAYDFMEKPLDRERLMVTLRNAVERRVMAAEMAGLRALTEGRWEMVGRSAAMLALFAQIAKVAPTRTRVLITGESGTGKELIARAIHRESALANKSFVKVNCAAIPPELIESELFGHERGAFTGATARKKGLFELADGGTIFLDEIGDMILSAQAKVLRVLQSGEFTRVGGEPTLQRGRAGRRRHQPRPAGGGRHRRLPRGPLLPAGGGPPAGAGPARAGRRHRPFGPVLRGPDLPGERLKEKVMSPEALALLEDYPWPGNVRELRNVDRAAGDPVGRGHRSRGPARGDRRRGRPALAAAATRGGHRRAAAGGALVAAARVPGPHGAAIHPRQAGRERLEHLPHRSGPRASSARTCTRRCGPSACRATIVKRQSDVERRASRAPRA